MRVKYRNADGTESSLATYGTTAALIAGGVFLSKSRPTLGTGLAVGAVSALVAPMVAVQALGIMQPKAAPLAGYQQIGAMQQYPQNQLGAVIAENMAGMGMGAVDYQNMAGASHLAI